MNNSFQFQLKFKATNGFNDQMVHFFAISVFARDKIFSHKQCTGGYDSQSLRYRVYVMFLALLNMEMHVFHISSIVIIKES